jgi:RNA recognition motif-containing protein
MDTNTSGASQRGRSGRRPRGGRNRNRRPGSSSSTRHGSTARPKKTKTLWEKIVGFFSGETAEHPAAQTSQPREEKPVSESRPAREKKERTPRKPEKVEVTSSRIYVGNLSFDATESDLQELFSGVGLVQNVEIVCKRETQQSKGFGFVQMQTIEEAKRAVDELHDKEYMGRKLVVSGAKSLDERPSRNRDSEETEPQAEQ